MWIQGDEPGAQPKPNPQYFGWGVVGKSKNNPDEFEWGWTNPILIPYVDAQGEIIDLRPHKRTQRGQSPRLYIPRPLKEFRDKYTGKLTPQFCVFAESEFKSAALFQVIGDQAAIAGLPGIAMAKQLFGDIEDWLYELGYGGWSSPLTTNAKTTRIFPVSRRIPTNVMTLRCGRGFCATGSRWKDMTPWSAICQTMAGRQG